ncbi:unnamed protein product [Orchesella dallaii]|uniref:Dynein assembly factor 3, axonemal n=1 Tax=Orchesella dallaii TaxID=48710 RepID=A0ABP1R9W9_9HEXA
MNRYVTDYINGRGVLNYWGFTPALDLSSLIDVTPASNGDSKRHIKIYFDGLSDSRHILQTLAKGLSKQDGLEMQFYISESNMCIYARQLVLLQIAFAPLTRVGLHEKVCAFMELHGNLCIRPQTKRVLKEICEELIMAVTDDDHARKLMPYITFKELRFKERDLVHQYLRRWRDAAASTVPLSTAWDKQLRASLGTRYDSRAGAFDWDYNMKVLEKDPKLRIIHATEYKKWRETGMAFVENESDYSQPNVTLSEGASDNAPTYSGDMEVGPYIPYGVKCEDASLLEKANDQYKKKSYDIAFHNIQEMLSILSPPDETGRPAFFQNFMVWLLPIGSSQNLWVKSKFANIFDVAFLSTHAYLGLRCELGRMLKPDAIVFFEKPRYVLFISNAYTYYLSLYHTTCASDSFSIIHLCAYVVFRYTWWFDKDNVTAFDKEVEQKAKTANLVSYPLDVKDISESLYRFKITEESNQTKNSYNSNSH